MDITAIDLIGIMKSAGKTEKKIARLGTIPIDYVSGRPKIIFDGETVATTRTYPYLASYTPTADDRVLVLMVGNSGVVLGKIT